MHGGFECRAAISVVRGTLFRVRRPWFRPHELKEQVNLNKRIAILDANRQDEALLGSTATSPIKPIRSAKGPYDAK